MNKKVLVFGYGDLAFRSEKLIGDNYEFFGVSKSKIESKNSIRFNWLENKNFASPDNNFHSIIYFPKPTNVSDLGYKLGFLNGIKNIHMIIKKLNYKSFITISSTRVFGKEQLGLLDEKTIPKPSDTRGKIILRYENYVKENISNSVILRLSGLYDKLKEKPKSKNHIDRNEAAKCINFFIENQNLVKNSIINCTEDTKIDMKQRSVSNSKLKALRFIFGK